MATLPTPYTFSGRHSCHPLTSVYLAVTVCPVGTVYPGADGGRTQVVKVAALFLRERHDRRAGGLMSFNPVPKSTDELPSTAIASESTGPAPQPPGGDANSADVPAEVAAGTPATEQVAGVGGDHAEAEA